MRYIFRNCAIVNYTCDRQLQSPFQNVWGYHEKYTHIVTVQVIL